VYSSLGPRALARREAFAGYSLVIFPMLPQVRDGGLGSYHEKVDARN